MSAVAGLAEAIKVIEFDPTKWFYGGAALVVFVLLIVVVTRFNIDR